jgi:hypothetical protein
MIDDRYKDPEDVVREALRLLRRRDQLLHDVKAGLEQLDHGVYTEYDEDSCEKFLADIEREEQARFPESERGE